MRISRFFVALAVTVTTATSMTQARPPNVVIILSDDQGWGDLSLNGNTNLSTPNIDRLAREGAVFDRFYVSPVCAPTRAELLTGRYHPRSGVVGVSRGLERMATDELTIADVFKSAGYATAAFGKWHNGTQYPYHPNGRGFDEFYGFCSGHWGEYFDPPLEHNGHPVKGNGYIVDDLTDHALDFIEHNKTRPFLCYLPFNTPHTPLQVPDEFFDKVRDREIAMRAEDPETENIEFTRAVLAMCENIDWNVGRVLDRLENLGLAEDTIVIYFSDNGPNSWRWNGGMRGRKGSTDEGGVRSPCIIRWPGKIAAGSRVNQIAGAIDLLPTLADLAGIKQTGKPAGPLDGVSLEPLLSGDTAPWPERMIFSHWNGRISVRTQTHRLDNKGRLYNMIEDPGQKTDIAAEQTDLAASLTEAVRQWQAEVFTGRDAGDLPYAVGYREFPITQLPARDAEPHGGIQRSSKYPNCSFFQNWTSLDDSITWDIEVANAGRYKVEALYACAEKNVGARVELSFKDSKLNATVTEPNDPPLRGMEHDRVPRPGESYVKDFKLWNMGEMNLAAGRGLLTVRALEIPGDEVMELRGLYLTLIE